MRYVRLDGQVMTRVAAAFALEVAGLDRAMVAHLAPVEFGRVRNDEGWEDYGHASKLRKKNPKNNKWMYKPRAKKAEGEGTSQEETSRPPKGDPAYQGSGATPQALLARNVEQLNTAKRYAHQMGEAGRPMQLAADSYARHDSTMSDNEAVALAGHAKLGDFPGRAALARQRLARHVEEDYFKGKQSQPLTLHAEPLAGRKAAMPRKKAKKIETVPDEPELPADPRMVELAARFRRTQDAAQAARKDEEAQAISDQFRSSLSDADAVGLLRHLWGGEPFMFSELPPARHPSMARTVLDLRVVGKRWFSRMKG